MTWPRSVRPPYPEPVTFVQRAGDAWLHWSVVEMDARAVPGAHAALCLVFAREGCIRRVWNYPIDWRALDDDELASLSWNR